ncbi:MAG: phage minor capsid protein [Clostridium sp.]|jgi:hypothetical protein|uniref:phage minor capsid protein n=1 Tax=Clostridium sp. TaxID=1506 RepID=UPI002912131D|nr:phage minor capsid protein [Clostridium sp.]MDU7339028.1 phage minor capsid protein [Clostridium sp.]
MLRPDYLDKIPNDFLRMYLDVENSIIEDMAWRIYKTAEFTNTAKWQYERLKAVNASYEYVMQQLERMTGKTEGELRKIFTDAGEEALQYDNQIYRYAGLDPPTIENSPMLQQQILTAYQNTQGVFRNLTRTTATTSQTQFINTLDRAALQLQSGAFTYQQVIKSTVKSLASDGVWAIQYPTGHVDKLDVASRRAVLTGVNQMASGLSYTQANEMGCDLVETTAHVGARPAHQAWQGRIFSRSGQSGKYPDFVGTTGYGTGAGICGWNCRHSFFPFFEGLSESAYSRKNLNKYANKKVTYNGQTMSYYDATQQQRYIERQIRRWKREQAGMTAVKQDANEAKAKIKQWQATQRDFLKQTGLDRDYFRERAGAQLTK